MMMDYAKDHPFRSFEKKWRKNKNRSTIKTMDEWGETFGLAGFATLLTVCTPVYRTWMIVRDLFIIPKDLVTSQFGEKIDEDGNIIESKKFNRLIFNITSALLLDPLYLLSTLVQAVAIVAASIFSFLPSGIAYYPVFACTKTVQYIEWANAVLSANLAEGLGLDNKIYYN